MVKDRKALGAAVLWRHKELDMTEGLNSNKMVLSFCAYIFSCPLDKSLKFNCWVIGLLHV